MDDEYRKMIRRISQMTDAELQTVWKNLDYHDLSEPYAPGISMDEWAMEIKGQMDRRAIEGGSK